VSSLGLSLALIATKFTLPSIIVSDGTHFLQAMLATQLNDLVADNGVMKHTVVRLNKFAINNVQGKRYALETFPGV
jgi:hypothetical protein